MDAGGLAQMNSNNFTQQPNGLGQMHGSGLASRRGGQNLKPLSLGGTPAPQDNGAPTPRTSRSHLLAGLRTAPKTATATSFGTSSQGMPSPTAQGFAGNRNSVYGQNQGAYENGPKTAMPKYNQQQQTYNPMVSQQQQQQRDQQQFTMEQVLAPPEIRVEDQDQMDPQMYAQLVATNMYLAQQQRALQQELYNLQAAAQQFQNLSLSGNQQQMQQQQLAMYQQQQRVQSMQQSMLGIMGQQQAQQQQVQQQQALQQQQQVYAYLDPTTGQTKYYVDPNAAQQQSYVDQQLAQMYGLQSQQGIAPRVQVSPPAESNVLPFRTTSPPKRNESPIDVTPLPPPSANAFRRGHKKIVSLAMPKLKESLALSNDAPKSAGPRTSSFPMTPLTGSYGPGGGRAGEHPVRQPKGPPSIDELKAKPTTRHEGSKNFSFRTRRSAVHNLVRAGRERRKGTGSSNGSMSPVSESAEESSTPITDNESESGRSGSGSLSGEMDCPPAISRQSTTGSWGAIGSDRPSSRQKTRQSLDSVSSATSGCESDKETSFASVFKNSAQKAGVELADGQRKAPRMVLTSVEKRKASPLPIS